MSPETTNARSSSLLVVGGGISGMTTAIEAAEAGREVYLVEQDPYLGGRVAKANKYFPKMCPPTCGLEINFQRIRKNPRIRVLTSTVVKTVGGQAGAFEVTLRTAPQYVTESYGISGQGAEASPEIKDSFNLGMSNCRALSLPHYMAFPMRYHIAEGSLTNDQLQKVAMACAPGTIDPAAKEKVFKLQVGAIVIATGWTPYAPDKLDLLGYGKCPDVITNVQMERLAANNGPTGGKILKRSTDEPAKKVAFVQCAGSRDENHLPYCSGVCCMASLKQSQYVREADPEATAEIFYIDLRSLGRLENFLNKVEADEGVTLTKGKVAEITQSAGGPVTIVVEDVFGGGRIRKEFDLVVLATGIVPNGASFPLPVDLNIDENGFMTDSASGVFATGMTTQPADVATCVQQATGTAVKILVETA